MTARTTPLMRPVVTPSSAPMDNALAVYAIYQFPRGYPDHFVVRRWLLREDEPAPKIDRWPLAIVNTLEDARAAIPSGLACIPRYGQDDPAIVEVWL